MYAGTSRDGWPKFWCSLGSVLVMLWPVLSARSDWLAYIDGINPAPVLDLVAQLLWKLSPGLVAEWNIIGRTTG